MSVTKVSVIRKIFFLTYDIASASSMIGGRVNRTFRKSKEISPNIKLFYCLFVSPLCSYLQHGLILCLSTIYS